MVPKIERNKLPRLLPPLVGIDFEFDSQGRPIILGVGNECNAWSSYYSREGKKLLEYLAKGFHKIVGHNLLTTEKQIIEKETGQELALESCEDTMVLAYLCNADFCATSEKDEDGDTTQRGIGLLDLWSIASLYTDLPAWKRCKDTGASVVSSTGGAIPLASRCDGPCPLHDVLGYNALDAAASAIILPQLQRDQERKNIPDALYQRRKRLTLICDAMQRQGIKVDRAVVRQIKNELDAKKEELFPTVERKKFCGVCGRMKSPPCKKCREGREGGFVDDDKQLGYTIIEGFDSPFNPQSPKQIGEYFGLRDTSAEAIEAALRRERDPGKREWLQRLKDYKDAGKDISTWFDDRHFDSDDCIHPRFNACGTATLRLASANPNFQNIPKVGFGALLRRAIVPRSDDYVLLRADYRQLELRMVLWYAFVWCLERPMPELPGDTFSWLVSQRPEAFDRIAKILGRKPRDAAKRLVHAANYLEGITVIEPGDMTSRRIRERDVGALKVYPDWEVGDGVVAFTGSNLAKDMFGSKSEKHRRMALEVQEIFFDAMPEIRAFHKRCSPFAERRFISTASGHYRTMYGSLAERMKCAASTCGQGGGAEVTAEAMLRFADEGHIPLLQLHDEIVFEVPKEWPLERCYDFMQVMTQESELFPGLKVPIEVKIGPNWLDTKELTWYDGKVVEKS